MQDAHDLGLVIDAGIALIALETHDEQRALDLLQRVARARDTSLFRWSVTDGLKRHTFGLQIDTATQHDEPEQLLDHIKTRAEPGIYALCDFHHWLGAEHPRQVRQLKDIALQHQHGLVTVVLISHRLVLPAELSRLSARFAMSLPDDEQILGLVREEAMRWAKKNGVGKVKTDSVTLQKLVSNLQGLTHNEVRRLARGAIIDDGAITETDIPEVNRAKFRLMDMDGLLSFEYRTESFANVGGMTNFKAWLDKRKSAFSGGSERHPDNPKGVLLLGVQGGGKSLAAKAVAGLWQLPLLKLDMGALYNKYHGETERNLRESLALADRVAPCVLWLDEIEKGLGGGHDESGISRRVLGTLLTWMAERTTRVFVVATANDISSLPPELVRKGRFDEIFFVDLPEQDVRQDIFTIHLRARELDPTKFSLPQLAAASAGFSGAEIEQAIVSALYSARASDSEINDALLLEEIASTSPISAVMAERIDALRQWSVARKVARV